MSIAIKIETLSKQYRLSVVGIGMLSQYLKRWWATNIMGKRNSIFNIWQTFGIVGNINPYIVLGFAYLMFYNSF